MFLEATAFFVLATAAVHGIPADHRERRRALVLAVLVGDDSKQAMAELIGPGRTNGGLAFRGHGLAADAGVVTVEHADAQVRRSGGTRCERGALLFGKILPVGIGAVIGAVGNRMVGKKIVRNARSAFGTPPARWPVTLHLLPTVPDAR